MSDKESKYEMGVIHGRFQILHNDHIKYLLAGKQFCNHLIVGITNPDPSLTRDSKTNPHRSTSIANPLNYFERYFMVQAALLEQDLKYSEFSIVPFPINFPELLKYYVPLDAIFFLTIYDDWGRQKRKYFESLGLNIHVLWERKLENKGLSSSDIREDMIKNKEWEQYVPKSAAQFIKDWGIIRRLKKLSREER
ncbi:MAG: adenylyltransferase/cytidyltransferase family protein [Promethearchaeota archaeon]